VGELKGPISLDDLIIKPDGIDESAEETETPPTPLSGDDLATWVGAAAALLDRVVAVHKERAYPLRTNEARALVSGLAAVLLSVVDVVQAVRYDFSRWVLVSPTDDRALRWTGEVPAGFEPNPENTPDQELADLVRKVGEYLVDGLADVDVAKDTLLRLVGLLSAVRHADSPAPEGER
jgi:hypothetical protein